MLTPAILLIACAVFAATMLGGLVALRLQDKLHLILGFSAGAVVAVAFFDLLPEALELASGRYATTTIISTVAIGFFAYLVLDRMRSLHAGDAHAHASEGGAATLSLHSFLDGVGVGLAFHVSPAVGAVLAAAVLAHDFSDGINTVSYIVKGGHSRARAMRWLFVDAIAPVIGILIASFIVIPETSLGLILALFTGFFLYIGASDLIPESHHAHPVYWTTIATLLGALVLYTAIMLAGA